MTRRARVVSQSCVIAVALLARDARAQGSPLGPEFRVNSYTTGDQTTAFVAASDGGGFIVLWSSDAQDGSNHGVFGQRFAASGLPAGGEFRVNSYTTSYQTGPAAAFDSSGNFVVVWGSNFQDGSNFGIFGQRYSATGAPLGPEFRVNTFTAGNQILHAVASAPTGEFVVVWASFGEDGSGFGIFGQRYAPSGAGLGSQFRVNTFTPGDQNDPAVGADTAGNFVVVWASDGQDGASGGIFGQRFAASGAALGPEFRVNTYTTQLQSQPAVAVDGSGGFVVAWVSYAQDGSNEGIFAQRYGSSGAALGPEFRVNSYTTSRQDVPSVAADDAGNFVAAWWSLGQDGSFHGVFARRFDSTGAPLTTDFQVNTYTPLFQAYPSVAADAAGNFVVTWWSTQLGAQRDIFGQRYAPILPVELMRFDVE